MAEWKPITNASNGILDFKCPYKSQNVVFDPLWTCPWSSPQLTN